jgi:hypothetical protein
MFYDIIFTSQNNYTYSKSSSDLPSTMLYFCSFVKISQLPERKNMIYLDFHVAGAASTYVEVNKHPHGARASTREHPPSDS